MTLTIRGNQTFSFFNSLFTQIVAPFQKAITASVDTVTQTWDNYFNLIDLKQENKKLKNEIDILKDKNNNYIEQNLHYQRLLKLFEFSSELKWKTVHSEVIGTDPSTWSRIIYINTSQSSVPFQKKMAVVTHDGLVGQVINSTEKSASVLLVTDVRSSIDVIIQRTRARGVVVGLNKKYCHIKYVPVNEDVKPGDRVISTGLGGVFPKGLLVGIVESVEKEKFGLFQHIKLIPSANLSRLEDVLIITSG